MSTSTEPANDKPLRSFQVEILENIECYFAATSVVQIEILDFDEACNVLLSQIKDLKLTDLSYLSTEFEKIFGAKPTDAEELIEYYDSSNAGICVKVVSEDEVLLSVRFEFDIENRSINFSCPEIEVLDFYRKKISGVMKS
jgi:hypothetical protein